MIIIFMKYSYTQYNIIYFTVKGVLDYKILRIIALTYLARLYGKEKKY